MKKNTLRNQRFMCIFLKTSTNEKVSESELKKRKKHTFRAEYVK